MTEKSYLQRRLEMKLGIKTSTDASASARASNPVDLPSGGPKRTKQAKVSQGAKNTPKGKPAGKPGKYRKMKTATKKRARQNSKYTKVKKKFLQDNATCQAQLEGCTGVSTDLHHIGGRTGENLL